jgi:hypothetical protein
MESKTLNFIDNNKTQLDEKLTNSSECFESFRDKHPDWKEVFSYEEYWPVQSLNPEIIGDNIPFYLNYTLVFWSIILFLFIIIIIFNKVNNRILIPIIFLVSNMIRRLYNAIFKSKSKKSKDNNGTSTNQLISQGQTTNLDGSDDGDEDEDDSNSLFDTGYYLPLWEIFLLLLTELIKILKAIRRKEESGERRIDYCYNGNLHEFLRDNSISRNLLKTEFIESLISEASINEEYNINDIPNILFTYIDKSISETCHGSYYLIIDLVDTTTLNETIEKLEDLERFLVSFYLS